MSDDEMGCHKCGWKKADTAETGEGWRCVLCATKEVDQLRADLTAAREEAKDYATHLDTAIEIIQRVHPVAAERGLGRLEVAAALRDLADNLTAARRELARFQWQPIESAPKTDHA
jgi:hypothetical protein